MTPIMLQRITQDIADHHGSGDKMLFVLNDGTSVRGEWHWLNHGKGGLDSAIVVHFQGRDYYILVESIDYIVSARPAKKTKEA